jgi:hypothetical protein
MNKFWKIKKNKKTKNEQERNKLNKTNEAKKPKQTKGKCSCKENIFTWGKKIPFLFELIN